MGVPTIELGDGLRVSAQGYGAMSLGPAYGPIDPEQALATLEHAVDLGVTFIDTANVYGEGSSERTIARLARRRRDELVIATKFGIAGIGPGRRVIRNDGPYARQSLDESLARLEVDHVDLYYVHRIDPAVPIEDTVGVLSELVQAGKVRHIGLSEPTADELRRAHAVHPIAAVQSEWSVFSRDVERRVVPAAAELGVGFVPYSPLSRAYLTGRFSLESLGEGDFRHGFPRFSPQAVADNEPLLAVVLGVAAEAGVTPAQVALAWLQAKGELFGLPSVAIPGTRFPDRVEENLAALDVVLTPEQVERLDVLAPRVSGARSAQPAWVSEGREG